jgi:hypothetical protein
MFRKLALALAATAALGTASLAVSSTPAEAKKGGFHHHHHHHGHHHHWRAHRYYGPAFVSYAATGCYVKKWVATPWGYKVRWVNVCF